MSPISFAASRAAIPLAARMAFSPSKMAKPILGVKPLGNSFPALPANRMSRKDIPPATPLGVAILAKYSPGLVDKIPNRPFVSPAASPCPITPLNGTLILEPK